MGSLSGCLGETSPYIGIVPGYIGKAPKYISRGWKYIAGLPRSLGALANNRGEGARNRRQRHFYISRVKKYITGASPAPPRPSWYIISVQKYIEMVPRSLGRGAEKEGSCSRA
jgi:hypothetical protein